MRQPSQAIRGGRAGQILWPRRRALAWAGAGFAGAILPALLVVTVIAVVPAHGQQPATASTETLRDAPRQGPQDASAPTAGVAPPQPVEAFGGPTSVAGQINADTSTHARRLFEPYRAFKGTVQQQLGLVFGIDYNALFQGATASLGDDIAASGAFRLFGHWTLVGRDTPFPGNLVFKVENRIDSEPMSPPMTLLERLATLASRSSPSLTRAGS